MKTSFLGPYTIFLTHLIIGIGTCLLSCIKLIILRKQINNYRIAFTICKTRETQQLFITYTYNSYYRYLNVLYLFIENYTCRTSQKVVTIYGSVN